MMRVRYPRLLNSTNRRTRFLRLLHLETTLLFYTCRINKRHFRSNKAYFVRATPNVHLPTTCVLFGAYVLRTCVPVLGALGYLPPPQLLNKGRHTRNIVLHDHPQARLLALVILSEFKCDNIYETKKNEKTRIRQKISSYMESHMITRSAHHL